MTEIKAYKLNPESQKLFVTHISHLLKYYHLEDIWKSEMTFLAVDYIMARKDYITTIKPNSESKFRNLLRRWLIDYYRDNHLIIDNPNVGNGLGSWHIQIMGDENRNIYCNQKMSWDSSFHKDLTVKMLVESDDNPYSLYSICTKCIKGYLRKGGRGK